jgi:3-oxoacyl-[acyl-carrier protein] reductase
MQGPRNEAGRRRLEGRAALVTGGSRGIGRSVALRLAQEGAAVGVNYRSDAAAAEQVVAEIRSSGGRAVAVGADVSRQEEANGLVATVEQALGRLDILVNNAGLAATGNILDTPPETLESAFAVNLGGPLWCAQAAALHLARHGVGRIVNVSSVGGLGTAMGGVAPYAVAKAALNMLTKRLAFELGPRGVTVNAVCPGLIETDMLEQTEDNEAFRALRTSPGTRQLIARPGKPADIASVVAFLASDDASFMTAQVLAVDGGRIDFLTRSG